MTKTKVDHHYVLGLGLAIGSVLFLVLAIGALGIVGDGGSADRLYAAVLAVGLVGTLVARLRPRGMAITMVAMAAVQALVTVVAMALVVAEVDDYAGASVVDLLGINTMYVALFCGSAWFFRRADLGGARNPVGAPVTGGR